MPGWSLNPLYEDELELEEQAPPPPPPQPPVRSEPSTSKRSAVGSEKGKRAPSKQKKPKSGTEAIPALFAPLTDSDDDDFIPSQQIKRKRSLPPAEIAEVWASTPKTARAATLRSFLSQRGAAGYTTQRDPCKVGEYFIELRVYNCREVEHTPADERWKHALVTLKVATDDKTPVWRAVSGLLQAGKAEFKNVQPIMFPAGLK